MYAESVWFGGGSVLYTDLVARLPTCAPHRSSTTFCDNHGIHIKLSELSHIALRSRSVRLKLAATE